MQRIVVIHMWLGKFPNYFKFWLQSCKNNNTIDFLICTDQDLVSEKNIFVYKTDLEDLRKRATDAIGFEVCLPSARKLCDFKGLYGLMMAEYVKNYDFWGFCDCDLIFGNIRNFFTDDILNKYDYILGLGHFHIQRVDLPRYKEVINTSTGMGAIPYWEKDFNPEMFNRDRGASAEIVFKDPKNHIFDEWPYGVAAKYLELYPEKVWSGFTSSNRCFEEPNEHMCSFRDLYNDDECYEKSFYSKMAAVFPIWKRKIATKRNRITKGAVYEYNEKTLFCIKNTRRNIISKTEILYVHFIHRFMKIKTADVNNYIIIPNAFVKYHKVNLIRLIAINMRIDHKVQIYKSKIKKRLRKWLNR